MGYQSAVSTPRRVRAAHSSQPAVSSRRIWLLVALAGTLMALVVAAMLGAIAFKIYESDLILPGVQVLGVELGGRYRTEARSQLETGWAVPNLELAVGDSTWSGPVNSLGISPEVDALVEQAYQSSRAGERMYELLHGQPQLVLTPRWTLDPAVARAYLETLALQVRVLPVNASIVVVDAKIATVPAQPGRALDVEATLELLESDPAAVMGTGRLDLVTQPVPPAVTDVSAAVAQAEGLLASAPTVTAYDPVSDETLSWTVPAGEWASWLWFEADASDPTQLVWGIDPVSVRAWVDGQHDQVGEGRYFETEPLAAALLETPVKPGWGVWTQVLHRPRQHVVQSGETLASIGRDYGIPYPWIQQANPQIGEVLSVGEILTIPSPDAMLPLPVVTDKRIEVSLSQQRMWAYENGALKWEWVVSTGIESSPTAPGVFQVQTHEENAYAENWDLWMPYFMGIYRPVPTAGFMNGFHGFPTRNGWQLLWTADLGRPVTYGCILLAQENAAALYEWATEGTVVAIVP